MFYTRKESYNESVTGRKYKELGISEKVYAFGEKNRTGIKKSVLKKIDANAEYNQMKVIAAMQKNRVSAECFNISSGYGYNDMGRDTLERGICRLFWRGRCAGTSTDHLWNPCTCARSDVQSASGR